MSKRAAGELALAPAAKRARGGGADGGGEASTSSSLPAPIMLLTGHEAAVRGVKYSPDGASLASCSDDKTVLLWRSSGECKSYAQLAGHRNAVVDVHWTTDQSKVLSASADKTARAWDADTGAQVAKLKEHSSFVNALCPARRGPPLVATASDDRTCRVWDLRVRASAMTLTGGYSMTSVAFADGGDGVYTGGIDNDVGMWDLRRTDEGPVETLVGHGGTVTGLALSPDGHTLLSNGMDGTLRSWDVRPFAAGGARADRVLTGHKHTFEQDLLRCAWSADGARVACGSGDRHVHVWDYGARELLYKLPGHQGAVAEVSFHPAEPVIASAGADKAIYLGEIAPVE
mmetsp:Transcript_4893/g.19552  ORF Transcript_4893/g.19552 Transcript_4893/m.19552 type:complete len:344 (-) Transcript_4893:56-1087(-)